MNEKTDKKQIAFDVSFLTAKYLIPVLERKWIVISLFFTGVIVSLVISSFIKPEYYSTASLLVQEPRSKISSKSGTNPMVPKNADSTYVLSEAELLKSAPFVAQVLKILPDKAKMDLEADLDPFVQVMEGIKRMAKGLMGERLLNWARKLKSKKYEPPSPYFTKGIQLTELKRRVIIKSKSKNAMIWITARSMNKDVSPILVERYIAVWMARNLEDNRKAIRIDKKFAFDQRITARKHFLEAEKKLLDFRTYYEIPPDFDTASGIGDIGLQLQLERLQSGVKAAKSRYNYLDTICLKMQMEEAGIAENIKMLDSPTTPGIPSKSVKQDILLAGILGALALGIGITLGLDFLKSPIRHENDITSSVDVPILGQVPRI